ncbi:MAG: hypothetical protein JST11_12185 [Acidobacteria bacterium]|nr:hypothetical protein [Acidobacteriota bacterium]
MLDEREIDALSKELLSRFSGTRTRSDYSWPSPPLNVLDCVLSLNRRYDSFVLPRVEMFRGNHPNLTTLRGLAALIRQYATPLHFSKAELNYNDRARAQTLLGVTDYLISAQLSHPGETEDARLKRWAGSVRPYEFMAVGVRGFGLAGFQYLRMLFGVQTAKPDVHVCRFVSRVVDRRLNDWEALELLESAAQRVRLPLREVDGEIWDAAARSSGS